REAVVQLDAVTQQNSATSEESASSSEELAAQAQSLQELVSRFKYTDDNIEIQAKATDFIPRPKNHKPAPSQTPSKIEDEFIEFK
ncbi:hypothetical protein K8I31_03280, partial [bacterium]|nr:hypothetical protein [bacterium]